MEELVTKLSYEGGSDACEGIMTTDTFKKEFAVSFLLDGKNVISAAWQREVA